MRQKLYLQEKSLSIHLKRLNLTVVCLQHRNHVHHMRIALNQHILSKPFDRTHLRHPTTIICGQDQATGCARHTLFIRLNSAAKAASSSGEAPGLQVPAIGRTVTRSPSPNEPGISARRRQRKSLQRIKVETCRAEGIQATQGAIQTADSPERAWSSVEKAQP